MYSKNNNVKITVGFKTFDIIRELIESIIIKFQEGAEELMNGSDFAIKVLVQHAMNFVKLVKKALVVFNTH